MNLTKHHTTWTDEERKEYNRLTREVQLKAAKKLTEYVHGTTTFEEAKTAEEEMVALGILIAGKQNILESLKERIRLLESLAVVSPTKIGMLISFFNSEAEDLQREEH